MKKKLLVLLLLASCIASAQPVVDITIGSSTNQITDSYGPYSNLWYDADLNAVIFAHRSNVQAGWPTSGFVIYDYSTDGGITWIADQGIAYQDTFNIMRARYPQAGIYNPPGNTIVDSAFVTTFGPATDGSSSGFYFNGTVPLGSSVPVQTSYAHSAIGSIGLTKSGMIVKNTRTAWWASYGVNALEYNDTIHLAKGVFNAATRMFDYSFQRVYVPVCTGASGSKIFFNQAVAFNDSGNIGYIAVIGNDWVCSTQTLDTTMGLIVYKTVDGGANWFHAADLPLSMVDPLLMNNGSQYQSGNQFDIGVDKNNTLHMLVTVLPYQPGNNLGLTYPFGSWGLFDITFNNVSDACLISHPETYFGEFGVAGSSTDPAIIEDNRLQFSRSWDGSKVFMTWFDTDTMLYGPVPNNFPDMHSRGYDVNQGFWTSELNFTEGTGLPADGNCDFANVSYYTINDGVNENIPMAYNAMSIATGSAVQFHYIGGAAVSGYNLPGNCMQLINKVSEVSRSHELIEVSEIYPNPTSGNIYAEVSLAKASPITLEVSNTLGQLLFFRKYETIQNGKTTLSIDGSMLSKGLYFVKVSTGKESIIKKVSVG